MNTLTVIAVHGVGDGTGETRKGFSKDLKSLVRKNVHTSADFWHECVWEDINEKIDERVRKIVCRLVTNYLQLPVATGTKWWQKALSFLGKSAVDGGLVAGGLLAAWMVDIVADFLLYLDSDHGQRIRDRLSDQIRVLADKHPEGIALVAHSLGSVIAYDVVAEAVKSGHPLPVKRLITFGSPLAWTFEIRDDDKKKEREYVSIGDVKWVNFYYKEDYVSLNQQLPTSRFTTVVNRLLELPKGTKSIAAHTAYWTDEVFAAEVLKLIELEKDQM